MSITNAANAIISTLIYLISILASYGEGTRMTIDNFISDLNSDKFPEEMTNKLNYCTAELAVPEKYVVMKYEGIKSNGND